MKLFFARAREAVKEMVKGLKNAVAKLKSHMDGQARSAVRAAAQKEKIAEKTETADLKARAKQASDSAKLPVTKDTG
jgi:hypothetical protein